MISLRVNLKSNAYFDAYIMDSEIYYQEYRKRPAIIVAPGGAYAIHATREGEPVALQFLQMGYQVVVLKYSIGSDRAHPEKGLLKNAKYPLQVIEMFETLHIVKQHADEWNIDPDRIYMMGFSAGGHVCASCGVRWNDPEIIERLSFVPEYDELKAKGIVLGYPLLGPNSEEFSSIHEFPGGEQTQSIMNYVLFQTNIPTQSQIDKVSLINYISPETVPMFIWHSIDDPVVDSTNSTKFISKLLENGVDAEYHLFGHGEHGKALENRLTNMNDDDIDHHLNTWVNLADHWMNRIGSK